MKLSGHTKPFAVFGHPIGHTLSPVMHNASFRSLGLDAIYLAFDVAPDRLMSVLPAMRDLGFGGVNLTVPLKEVAFRGIDDLADTAQRLGAVNTVEFVDDGTLRGHNTDGDGFLAAMQEAFGQDVNGARVLVLGCGGAGRAIALTSAASGASQVLLTDLEADRVSTLSDELHSQAPDCETAAIDGNTDAWVAAARDADVIVQCTPVGMKPGDPELLPPDAFASGKLAFDLVYMYPETAFMRSATAGGARAANGLGMLMHQGARSFTIWTGTDADTAAMRGALEAEVYSS